MSDKLTYLGNIYDYANIDDNLTTHWWCNDAPDIWLTTRLTILNRSRTPIYQYHPLELIQSMLGASLTDDEKPRGFATAYALYNSFGCVPWCVHDDKVYLVKMNGVYITFDFDEGKNMLVYFENCIAAGSFL